MLALTAGHEVQTTVCASMINSFAPWIIRLIAKRAARAGALPCPPRPPPVTGSRGISQRCLPLSPERSRPRFGVTAARAPHHPSLGPIARRTAAGGLCGTGSRRVGRASGGRGTPGCDEHTRGAGHAAPGARPPCDGAGPHLHPPPGWLGRLGPPGRGEGQRGIGWGAGQGRGRHVRRGRAPALAPQSWDSGCCGGS